MAKYLKKFKTEEEYESFSGSKEFILPNVSFIETPLSPEKTLKFNPEPHIPPKELGDIAYWDGNKVKTINRDGYNADLGVAIGVVAIPEGMLPDGKTRIVSLKYTSTFTKWSSTKLSLLSVNYRKVSVTDNVDSSSRVEFLNNYKSYYIPSDSLTGVVSFVDPNAKYYSSDINSMKMIPSPYFGDNKTLNPGYGISEECALGDFTGLSNTELLRTSSYATAAKAAWNYSDESNSNLQWYLPSIGELGILAARINEITNSIKSVGGRDFSNGYSIWSSTEYDANGAFNLNLYLGMCSIKFYYNKEDSQSMVARPFAIID